MTGNELEMKRPKHRPISSVHIKSLYKRSSKRGSDGGAFTFVHWISSASNETDLFSLPEKSGDFCECSLAQEAFVKIIDWRWYCWLSQQCQQCMCVFNSCIFSPFLDIMLSERYWLSKARCKAGSLKNSCSGNLSAWPAISLPAGYKGWVKGAMGAEMIWIWTAESPIAFPYGEIFEPTL